jgi:hypothetical protein
MTADATGTGDPPGGSAGIAGAVLFGAINVVLIVVAPYPPDTPRVQPTAAPSFESAPPATAREPACDRCDRICERCRELCGRGSAANWDPILELLSASDPDRCHRGVAYLPRVTRSKARAAQPPSRDTVAPDAAAEMADPASSMPAPQVVVVQ